MEYNPDSKPWTKRANAVDTCIAMYIQYIGAEASGIVDIANTTGDITFKHGDASSEAADTSLFTNGICDMSAEAATWKALLDGINASANWKAWLVGVLPTDATEASGTAKFLNNITGAQGGTGDCKVSGGYALKIDTSAALYHCIGVTEMGDSSKLHDTDHQVAHYLRQIKATTTYASGTSIIYVYECDDDDGTATDLTGGGLAGGATTVELAFPTNPEDPIMFTDGKRLVVKVVNSAAMTAADMTIVGETIIHGPAPRHSQWWAHNQ